MLSILDNSLCSMFELVETLDSRFGRYYVWRLPGLLTATEQPILHLCGALLLCDGASLARAVKGDSHLDCVWLEGILQQVGRTLGGGNLQLSLLQVLFASRVVVLL